MNPHWPPPSILAYRSIVVVLVVLWITAVAAILSPLAHSAGLTGRYVQLLVVTNGGCVSVVHDLTVAECNQVIVHLRAISTPTDYRNLSCLPIDYNTENKKR